MSWRPAKPHQAGTSRALVQGSQSWGGVCRDRAREPLTHHSKVTLCSSALTERSLAGQPGAAPQGAGMRISGVPALLNMLLRSGAPGPAGPPRQAWPSSLFLLPRCWVPTDCGLPWPPGPALLTPGPCCPCWASLAPALPRAPPHHPQPLCPSKQGDAPSEYFRRGQTLPPTMLQMQGPVSEKSEGNVQPFDISFFQQVFTEHLPCSGEVQSDRAMAEPGVPLPRPSASFQGHVLLPRRCSDTRAPKGGKSGGFERGTRHRGSEGEVLGLLKSWALESPWDSNSVNPTN